MTLSFIRSGFKTFLKLALVAGIFGAAIASGASDTEAEEASAWFTAEQAARGEGQFRVQCAECHGRDLEGGAGPALSAGELYAQWGTAGELYTYYAGAMPPYAPGQLGEAIYTDILAFILSFNGYPAGDVELPTDPELFDEIVLTPQD